MASRGVQVSKFLALHLRHAPEKIGVSLGPGGWVEVSELLRAAEGAGFPITREELDAAVSEPTKRRYAYDETGSSIRAVQGHSVSVELGYTPQVPPAIPVRPGACYFSFEPRGALYDRMLQAQSAMIYTPSGINDLNLELIAVTS